jgi:hypothetical protein
VKGAEVLAFGERGIGGPRRFKRPFRIQAADGIGPRIDCFDALEMCPHNFFGGNRFDPDKARQVGGRPENQFGV